MIGIISSFNVQKRCGYIKEKEKKVEYFFRTNNIIDKTLQLKVGNVVEFELFKVNEKKTVAIRIHSHKFQSSQSSKSGSDHVDAVVVWYDEQKRYGYVTCQTTPRQKAFLHQNQLLKVGLSSAEPGLKLKVRLVEDKYPGKPSAVDIIVQKPDTAVHKKGSSSSQPPNFIMQRQSSQNHVFKRLHHIPNKKHTSNDYSAIPFSTNSNFNRPSAANNATFNNHFPPHMNDMLSMHNDPYLSQTQHHQPLFPSNFGPSWNNDVRPWCNDMQQPYSSQKNFFHSNPSPYFNDMNELNPEPPHQQGPKSRSRLVKTFSNPECAKINQEIQQMQGLLKSLSFNKMPQRVSHLQDQIKELKARLKELCLTNESRSYTTSRTNSVSSTTDDDHNTDIKESRYDISVYSQSDQELWNKLDDEHDGDNMPEIRTDTASKVARDTMEKFRSTLTTCPSSSDEVENPDGILVNLLPHQRQALSWLRWKEQQSISGGILADDAGLGKTLTMISFIIAQMSAHPLDEPPSDVDKQAECESATASDHQVADKVDDNNVDGVSSSFSDKNKDAPPRPTLIVVPASLVYYWETEIINSCKKNLFALHVYHGSDEDKVADGLSQFDIVITSYDIVRQCNPEGQRSTKSKETKPQPENKERSLFWTKWRRIILDEADLMRRYESQTARAVYSLSAESRWALFSTPLHNDLVAMYSMIKFLRVLPFHEYKVWREEVRNGTKRGQERFESLVAGLVLRREKEPKIAEDKAAISLPKETAILHTLQLNKDEQQVYNNLKSRFQALVDNYEDEDNEDVNSVNFNPYGCYDISKKKLLIFIVTILLRLMQCCSHLTLLDDKLDIKVLRKALRAFTTDDPFCPSLSTSVGIVSALDPIKISTANSEASNVEPSSPSSKVLSVIDALQKLRSETPDEKCVLVSQWAGFVEPLARHLGEAGIECAVIDNAISGRKRMNLVDDFNRNSTAPKVLLIFLGADDMQLNITGGNHLFLLDIHLNSTSRKHLINRIKNVGQPREVFIHEFTAEGTVEGHLLELLKSRSSSPPDTLGGVTADEETQLTFADMKSLSGM